MIDRTARDQAAATLRRFIDGEITNFQYDDACPPSKDAAVLAIWQEIWFLYDDLHEHRLTGLHALNEQNRRAAECCVLFLQSDMEYRWPAQRLLNIRHLRELIHGDIGGRAARIRFADGDRRCWPFYSEGELQAVAQDRFSELIRNDVPADESLRRWWFYAILEVWIAMHAIFLALLLFPAARKPVGRLIGVECALVLLLAFCGHLRWFYHRACEHFS